MLCFPLGAALLFSAGVAAAQQRPDFSGTWVLADTSGARSSVAATGDAGFRRGDMGSGWGSPLTISQRPDSLIVEYTVFSAYDLQPPLHFGYALDGSETRNAVMVSHAESVQRCKVAWRGDTMIITTLHPVPDLGRERVAVAEVRQALTLSSPRSLVVETTRVGILGGPTTTTRTTYTRR
jgi:hypothetical protein